jgi:hypothetical protein
VTGSKKSSLSPRNVSARAARKGNPGCSGVARKVVIATKGFRVAPHDFGPGYRLYVLMIDDKYYIPFDYNNETIWKIPIKVWKI